MTEKLNCRPGDVAVTINSAVNGGLIVNVLEFFGSYEHGEFWIVESIGSEFNVVRSATCPSGLCKKTVWPDHNLRPIRDQPGADETLRWAGRPKYIEDHPASLAAVRESLEDLVWPPNKKCSNCGLRQKPAAMPVSRPWLTEAEATRVHELWLDIQAAGFDRAAEARERLLQKHALRRAAA